jgi:WD40 repeat protein
MERRKCGKVHVIPIILRSVDLKGTALEGVESLPRHGKSVATSRNRSEVFYQIALDIRNVAEESGFNQIQEDSTGERGNESRVSNVDDHDTSEAVEQFSKQNNQLELVINADNVIAENVPISEEPLSLQSRPLQGPTRHISRRSVVGALVGLGLLAAGGTYAGLYLTKQTSDGRILYHTEFFPEKARDYTVNYIQWSPKGNYLVTADGDKTVSVLDASSGKRKLTYARHGGFVDAAVWSPDGTEIASASTDKTVQVWNAKNGSMRLKYLALFSVWSVAWSPNGANIALAGEKKATQVWDAGTDKLVSTYQGPTEGIWALAWSHDSKRIAIGYSDGTVEVRSATDGYLFFAYHGQAGTIYEVMWSHYDDAIVSASKDHTVHVWDGTNGAHRLTYLGHSAPVHAAEWSPDGKLIASAGEDDVVLVWDATTGTMVHTYSGHTATVGSLTWSLDGKHIASGSDDGTIRIWDVQ